MRLPRLVPLLLCALLLFAAACDTGDPGSDTADNPADAAAQRLVDSLEANDLTVLETIVHSDNAEEAGLMLPPTHLILFGNPELGTPLMQDQQTVAIDLPQKFLVYEDAGGLFVTYNAPSYLSARHELSDAVSGELNQIGSALERFADSASDTATVNALGGEEIEGGEGLVTTTSAFDFNTTLMRLQDSIEVRDSLTIMAEVDHTANAEENDLTLRPTYLLIFGNPRAGTPLMNLQRSIGIDLPQKMLVYEDADGNVMVAYNDPFYLAQRHGIPENTEQLQPVADVLSGLAAAATTDADDTDGDQGGDQ